MATVTQQRLRGRPAHPSGPTFLAFTPNGRRLITAGSNNAVRVYTTGSDGEPTNIDDCQENNTAVAATNEFFITGSEDGTVCMYSLETNNYEKMLTRCTLPIRDVALSPDGKWAAVASDEMTVKIVNTHDITKVLYLRDQSKAVKHISFHPSGSYIAVSCTDGIIYIYNIASETPEIVRKVDGVIRNLEADAEATSRAVWHPDGRAFAAPTATRDVVVVSRSDGERQKVFTGGHMGDITALAWSPNGALLITAGSDHKILLWDARSQKILTRYDHAHVINIVWHSHENLVSFTTSEGELFIHTNFVPPGILPLLEAPLQPAPFIHDPLSEISGNERRALTNGHGKPQDRQAKRVGTPDSLDDILGSEAGSDLEDDFVVDDDGAGYSAGINGYGKRVGSNLEDIDGVDTKRRATFSARAAIIHPSFQPGSTPWRGDRKYLCLNLTGFVWTVDQDTHRTVTVEFYDREYHRDFHFTDPYLYDKACLNENGTLFSCPPANGNPAMVFYRPHETWTSRADWRTQLPIGEDVTSISLSDSYIVVTTSADYVRIYTLFGTPFSIYRQKSLPAVTCTSWRDYVLTIGNGPISADGSTRLLYTIENVKRSETCQSEDTVALPSGVELQSVFYSDNGDPYIYDTSGVLLILQHWRTPGQAQWVPVLDTKTLDRLASGRKDETYWPVAVAADKFHCIILKGGDKHPYFPRPLLSEFEFKIPVSSIISNRPKPRTTNGDIDDLDSSSSTFLLNEGPKLEESYLRSSLFLSLFQDLLASTHATSAQRAELAQKQVDVDKVLLQLLNVECREGEERGMKALELVKLMRDRSGRMIEAAGKVASRYERGVLEEKIAEVAERRLMGLEGEEEEDEG